MDDTERALQGSPIEAEYILWHRLRRRRIGGFRFRRHVPVGRYVCDFVCPQARLVIALDGNRAFERHDERRTQFLQWQAMRGPRFWNSALPNQPTADLT